MKTLRKATTAFEVDGQWYEMEYSLCRALQMSIGPNWTNREIVQVANRFKHLLEIVPGEGFLLIRRVR